MTDKMREEFEAWFHDKCCHGRGKANYGSVVTLAAWESWKASRAALCVELPSKINDQSDKWSNGYDFGIDDAQDALDAAGVSYK